MKFAVPPSINAALGSNPAAVTRPRSVKTLSPQHSIFPPGFTAQPVSATRADLDRASETDHGRHVRMRNEIVQRCIAAAEHLVDVAAPTADIRGSDRAHVHPFSFTKSPATTSSTPEKPGTANGTEYGAASNPPASSVAPTPSWPYSFFPQQRIVLSASSAQVFSPAAEIWMMHGSDVQRFASGRLGESPLASFGVLPSDFSGFESPALPSAPGPAESSLDDDPQAIANAIPSVMLTNRTTRAPAFSHAPDLYYFRESRAFTCA